MILHRHDYGWNRLANARHVLHQLLPGLSRSGSMASDVTIWLPATNRTYTSVSGGLAAGGCGEAVKVAALGRLLVCVSSYHVFSCETKTKDKNSCLTLRT
ncbi:hypothetical protein J6590_073815 [Homalodisca vitripennis]|nr:hypothetical protein J6590_073815 [Homalodisca vitripennis]